MLKFNALPSQNLNISNSLTTSTAVKRICLLMPFHWTLLIVISKKIVKHQLAKNALLAIMDPLLTIMRQTEKLK